MTSQKQIHAEVECTNPDCKFYEVDGAVGSYGKAYQLGYRHWKKTGHEVNIEVGQNWIIGEGRRKKIRK